MLFLSALMLIGQGHPYATLLGLTLVLGMAAGVVARNVSPSRGMDVYGHSAVCPFQYTGPNPYATGGDQLADAMFKLGVVEYLPDFLGIPAAGTTAVLFHYNIANHKMQAFWVGAGFSGVLAEVANGTDLSTFIGNGCAFGKG